ncbi:MAG: hypothetical protein J0L52_11160 [Caulobacterales bacterium]|nr:hypothetical protein [Caulobacterales bacterium]
MSWMNLARTFKVVALVLFLTPWLVVSCQGSPLIEASGLDMITGDLEPSRDSSMGAMLAQAGAEAGAGGLARSETPEEPGEGPLEEASWWVMLGAGLIAAALVLGLVLRPARRAAAAAAVASLLAFVTLGAGMGWTVHEFKSELRAATEPPQAGTGEAEQFGRTMAAGFVGGIAIDVRWGFWMTELALLLATAAAGLAATGRSMPRRDVSTQEPN